jgi:hypothetical protein
MNTLTLDNAAIMEAVVGRLVDEFMRTDDQLYDEVEKRISKKIDDLFIKRVEPRIQQELDRALADVFHKEYQKRTAWGEAEGEITTISKELEKLMSGFWAQTVDKDGKPNAYAKLTRAEFTMAKVLGDDFGKQTERYLVQAAAWLKDGMRDHLRGEVDKMLANLFHVKSAQDTAEGRYK